MACPHNDWAHSINPKTKVITDEMVEQKAKEIYNDGAFHGHNKWLYADATERNKWREFARNQLEAELA